MAGRFGRSKSKTDKRKRTQSTGRFALESHSRDVDSASTFGLSASKTSLTESAKSQLLLDDDNFLSLGSMKDISPGKGKIPRKDLEKDLLVRIKILSETQKQLSETENELKETRRLLEREQFKREIAELQREAGKLNLQSLESLPRRIREMLDTCVQKVVIQGESKTVNLQVGENNLMTTPKEEANDVITRIGEFFKNYDMTLEANHRMEKQMEEMREAFEDLPTNLSQQLFHRDRKLLQILTSDKSDKKVISEGFEELKRWFRNKKDQNEFPWLTDAAIIRLVNKFESLNIYCKHFAEILHIDLSGQQIDGNSKLDENSCKTILVHFIRQPASVEVADILHSIDELESKFAKQIKEGECTARAIPSKIGTEQTRSNNAAVSTGLREKEILIEEVRESLKQWQNRLSDQLTLRDKNIIYMMTANLPERYIIIEGLEQLQKWSKDENDMKELPWFTKAAITRLINKFETLNCTCKQLEDILHIDLSALQIDGFSKLDDKLCKTALVYWSQQTETVKAVDVMNGLDELDSRFDMQTKTKYVDKTTMKEQELHADTIKQLSGAVGLQTKTSDATDSVTMAYLDTILRITTDTFAMLHNIYEK